MEDIIIERGITDRKIIEALKKVERHLFVPKEFQDQAYDDRPLSIGHEQTISQPYVVAYMTEALRLEPTDRVLEIGTGSGYQAAILAEIVNEVYSIEIIKALGQTARRILDRLNYKNIFTRIGDGYKGWPEKAPFDKIILTAAPEHIPEALVGQLKPGGILVMPIGYDSQKLIRLTKTEESFEKETLLPVRFVPMTGEALSK